MSPAMRRVMASFSACTSSTSSIASNSAGIFDSPAALSFSQSASTSCQSRVANRKPGEIDLPSRTRSSVFSSASMTKRSPIGCSRITSSSGSRPWCRPSSRSCCRHLTAWPEVSSLSISSNRRAGGTFSSSSAISRIGGAPPGRWSARAWRQAHGAQHAHRVFAVAGARVADHAQGLLLEVGDAVVVVDDRLGGRVVVQRVDGEVAAGGVFGWLPKTLSRSTRPCSSVVVASRRPGRGRWRPRWSPAPSSHARSGSGGR
jgi:hypothetical protein